MDHKKNIEGLSRGTIDGWENRYFHLEFFSELQVRTIDQRTIDRWIDMIFSLDYKRDYWRKSRLNFRHELSLLKQILNYYREYYNNQYIVPVERRHSKSLLMKNRNAKTSERIKYLSRDEALNVIKSAPDEISQDLMLLQLRTGMRIGEVAALRFDRIDFVNSILMVDSHVDWPRRKGSEVRILNGTRGCPSRELPLSADCLTMLLRRRTANPNGSMLVFEKNERVLSYRFIQHRYDLAFNRAGIIGKNGSHTLRHTFAVDFISETGKELALQALLGHSKLEDTMRYGKYLKLKVHSVFEEYKASAMELNLPKKTALKAI